MSKKAKIGLFIAVFCVILLIPFAKSAGKAVPEVELSYDTPAINAMSDKQCIESAEYMRAHHMTMLNEWRDEVVREGDTQYVSTSGQIYDKSLDDTCLGCHSNPEEFCDTCHEAAAVDLYCWDCHGLTDDPAKSAE